MRFSFILALFILISCASSKEQVVKEKSISHYTVIDWSCSRQTDARTVIFVFTGLVVHPEVDPKLKMEYENASWVSTRDFLKITKKKGWWRNPLSKEMLEMYDKVTKTVEFTYLAPSCPFDFDVVDLDGKIWKIIVSNTRENKTIQLSCHRPVGTNKYDNLAYCTTDVVEAQ
jgi:hypothetical protein